MKRVRNSPPDVETKRRVADHCESHDENPNESVQAQRQGARDQPLDGVTGATTGLSSTASTMEATGVTRQNPRREVAESDDALRITDTLLGDALGDGKSFAQELGAAVQTTDEGEGPDHGESNQDSARPKGSFVSRTAPSSCFRPRLLLFGW